MKKEEKDLERPQWFVYDADGGIDLEKSLQSLPADIDFSHVFFREVPEWFEVDENIEEDNEICGILTIVYENLDECDKKLFSEEEFAELQVLAQKYVTAIRTFFRADLTEAQKLFVRGLCYWYAVAFLSKMPDEMEL